MKIDVFFDAFPHPAKPNLETQLLEWQRQGHCLRIFSLGPIGNATTAFTVTFLKGLRQQPFRMMWRVLSRVFETPARSWQIVRNAPGFRVAAKRLARDAQLPPDSPDVHFMHNLTVAVPFSYLEAAAPSATYAIYYHGGELPGVPQISAANAADALGRAELVFSNTPASVAEVIGRGACRERTICAPTSFDIKQFQLPADRRYLAGGRWRFVCVGRMAPEKGFDLALKSLSALRQRNLPCELTVIGDGPEQSALEALVDRLYLHDTVRFMGRLEFSALIPQLAEFDVLILSSVPVAGSNWRETQATVMQEAMLMGAVVVASDIGGARDSLPPELHRYLFPPGSVDELTDRLHALMQLNEPALRALSEIARRFVVENYDIRQVNGLILSRLAACRGNGAAPRPSPIEPSDVADASRQ